MHLTICLQFNINFRLFSQVMQVPHARREMGSLTRKPTSAQADSPVRENSPGLGTSGWYLLLRNSSDRFGALLPAIHDGILPGPQLMHTKANTCTEHCFQNNPAHGNQSSYASLHQQKLTYNFYSIFLNKM